MARYKSLRTRVTKDIINDLRERVAEAYSHKYIARRRMDLLMGILDLFEREAFLPHRYTEKEKKEEAVFDETLLTRKPVNGKVAKAGNTKPKRG